MKAQKRRASYGQIQAYNKPKLHYNPKVRAKFKHYNPNLNVLVKLKHYNPKLQELQHQASSKFKPIAMCVVLPYVCVCSSTPPCAGSARAHIATFVECAECALSYAMSYTI